MGTVWFPFIFNGSRQYCLFVLVSICLFVLMFLCIIGEQVKRVLAGELDDMKLCICTCVCIWLYQYNIYIYISVADVYIPASMCKFLWTQIGRLGIQIMCPEKCEGQIEETEREFRPEGAKA